jgi:hypothetical protein
MNETNGKIGFRPIYELNARKDAIEKRIYFIIRVGFNNRISCDRRRKNSPMYASYPVADR